MENAFKIVCGFATLLFLVVIVVGYRIVFFAFYNAPWFSLVIPGYLCLPWVATIVFRKISNIYIRVILFTILFCHIAYSIFLLPKVGGPLNVY